MDVARLLFLARSRRPGRRVRVLYRDGDDVTAPDDVRAAFLAHVQELRRAYPAEPRGVSPGTLPSR